MKKIIILLLFIFSFLNADITEYFPKLEGRVIDQANMLSPDVKKDIDAILKKHEKETSNQIVVVILNSLNGYTIEDFSYQLGRFWQIGQKDKNNGVLLVVSKEERKVRIEVGYGLEGALTDKISHEIINYTIKPNFKANQYELGILKAVNEIMASIKGEYVQKERTENYNDSINGFFALGYFVLFFISTLINSASKKIKSVFLFKISDSALVASFIAFFTLIVAAIFTTYTFLVALIVFVVIFVLIYTTTKHVDFNKLSAKEYTGSSGFGGFGSSSSSSSDSDSFFGGGGSFGGGGASGDW